MPSTVSWLDTSAEQMKQAREVIKLFAQPDSRDELGIGTIRDAFSNLLFPGTSVLQTRARYYLFIPWAYQAARASGRTADAFVRRAGDLERELVLSLIQEEPARGAGVIGRRARHELQTLPSTIYWGGMQTYGIIRTRDVADIAGPHTSPDDATEMFERRQDAMDPNLPPQPAAFPRVPTGGFAMTQSEAEWLRERIIATRGDTPLARLLRPATIDRGEINDLLACPQPWDHPLIGEDRRVVHAQLFSKTMHGASLLYNLLVAEICAAKNLEAFPGQVEAFRDWLTEWRDDITRLDDQLSAWHDPDLWSTVTSDGAKIPPSTIQFVRTWLTELRRHRGAVADHQAMRDLVARREQRKGSQSRLLNERMLPTWSGASGAGELSYRWPNVRRIAADIFEGLTA